MSIEDDGPVVGSEVSTVMPYLPAGEVASNEGKNDTHMRLLRSLFCM